MSEETSYKMTDLHAGDRQITKLFVAKAKKEDKFICFVCNEEFDSEPEFIKHFQEHIDGFLRGERRRQ